jgi:hypothetical protein
MNDNTPVSPRPKYATIQDWRVISGMRRSRIYTHIASGELPAVKLGNRTLIDVEASLAWMSHLPPAVPRKPATPRKRAA